FTCACRSESSTSTVVNDLSINMLLALEDGKARTLRSADEVFADSLVANHAHFASRFNCHRRFSLLRAGPLTGSQLNNFALIANALALVRVGLSDLADVCRELTDESFIDSAHGN